MSCFLKLQDQSLILVDFNSRNGLYYQTFKQNQSSRLNLLLSNGTHEYTAFLDENSYFHVIAKNTRNQIIHFKESPDKIAKEILLDDTNNTFKIDNIYAVSVKNQIHLFYYSDHPSTKNTELIHHLVNKPFDTPKPIGSIYNRNLNFDCIRHKDELFLAMINKNEKIYTINIYSFDRDKELLHNTSTPVNSEFPITYCKLCIDRKGRNHLIYVQEQYGQYQLIYKNKSNIWSKEQLLYSSGYAIKPVIFIYNDALWVNWNENGILKAILSVNIGNNFSKAIPVSMEDSNISLHSYDAYQGLSTSLICNQLYGVNYPTPKFAVLYSLDMDGIHSNMVPNGELKLYLKSIKDLLKLSVSKSELEEENIILQNRITDLTQIQNDITEQYNELASLTKKIQDEGRKWRDLYNKAKIEIEFYKKRAKQLEKSISFNNQNKIDEKIDMKEADELLEAENNISSEIDDMDDINDIDEN